MHRLRTEETAIRDDWPAIRVLGSRVHVVTMDDVIDWLGGCIANRNGPSRQLVVTGFHGIWEAHKNDEFKRILNSADLWVPDGIAPVWIARRKGFAHAQRTPGAEIMKAFLERANERGYRSFFYGDTDQTLGVLKDRLERDYPGHVVAGTYSPPFRPLSKAEDDEIVERINAAEPDVVWVGLGLPKQDYWVHEHKDRLNAAVATGVGAAFSFMAQTVRRVPRWIGNMGLEWLWRLGMEPGKLWRRNLVEGPQFVAHVLAEMTGLRRYD